MKQLRPVEVFVSLEFVDRNAWHLSEHSLDLLVVCHHVQEEVDTHLRRKLVCLFVMLAPTLVTCSSRTDQEPLRMATSAVERWR